jgi:hypothetical protein
VAQKPLTDEQLLEAVEAYTKHRGNSDRAAASLNINESTFRHRLAEAERRKTVKSKLATENNEDEGFDKAALLHDQLRSLRAQLHSARKTTLDEQYVREKIIKLAESESLLEIPNWMIKPLKTKSVTGVPTIFASDWHWGEVVDTKQINDVNRYDLRIAQERAQILIQTATGILKTRFANPEYPGIVFALGGDMVSGDIHEELSVSNEREIMPIVIDLWGILTWCIETLANEFGNVFVPCVTGNHGRNTYKIRAKGRNFTSFDWLVYNFLAKRFENDPRVRFLIPDGSDAYFQIYGHRYLLTHGDQFRGGDGMIGALGPIIRGDHKKRSRNAQIDTEYDTLLLGHWHQLIQLQRLIVNGSLKGYDEYAYQNNFPFEPPRQALWITHPEHGITFSAPILVDRTPTKRSGTWVSWKA